MATRPRSRRRRILTGLTVSFVTLVVIGIGLEIGVRLVIPEAVFSPFQPIYRTDSTCGYTLRPNLDTHAFGVGLASNRLGFRGPEWTEDKPNGTFRIALIGDSHAFGYGVEFEQSVGEALARNASNAARDCEVLNFALPGYNSTQQLAALSAHALRFAPDVVLVLLCENDHEPQRWADGDGWLHRARPDLTAGEEKVEYRPLLTEKSLLRHSRFAMYAKLLWMRASLREHRRATAPKDPVWLAPVESGGVVPRLRPTVFDPLLAMSELCAEREIPLVLATLAANPDYRRMVRSFNTQTGVPTLALLELYPEVKSWRELATQHGLGWNDHLSAASHSRWGVAIFDLLAREGWL